MYHLWYTEVRVRKANGPKEDTKRCAEDLARAGKRLPAVFFRTETGREPVRDWLRTLPYPDDRKRIGEDI